MKKKILMIVIAVFAMGNVATMAQKDGSKISFGVKGEANSSFNICKNLPLVRETTNGFGANAGAFLKRDILENLAFQVELLGQYKNSEFQTLTSELELSTWGIEVPAYIMGQFKGGRGLFYFGAGPYGIALFTAEMNDVDVLKENNYFSLSRWNLGVGMIAGFELKCGLQFNVNYKYAMFNSLQNADVANMIENTASIGIGYRF